MAALPPWGLWRRADIFDFLPYILHFFVDGAKCGRAGLKASATWQKEERACRLEAGTTSTIAEGSDGGYLGLFLAAGVGYYEADVFVSDLFGDGFLDGFEQIEAEAGAGFKDVLLVDGMHPVRAKRQLALLDKVGNQGNDGGDFSAAKLGDFFEGAALIQEFERFLRWA